MKSLNLFGLKIPKANMRQTRITLETICYAIILAIALFLRFQSLGHNPLNITESRYALQALAISRGEPGAITGEPGYVVLTAGLFSLFQADELHARLFPALFGSLFVLVPFLFRNLIKKKVAILLAFFMAIDPILITQSRTAGGSMLALLGLFAGIGFLLNRKGLLAAVSIGLALLGGMNFWLGFILFLLVGFLFSRQVYPLLQFGSIAEDDRHALKVFAIALGVVVVVLGTLFMLIPKGINGIGSGLTGYIASWSEEDGFRMLHVLIACGLTYLPILSLAVWGIFISKTEQRKPRLFILAFFLATWLLAVLNPSLAMQNLAWTTVPLWLLVSLMISDFFESLFIERKAVWLSMTALFIVMSGFSFTNLNNLFYEVAPTTEIVQGRLLGVLLPYILLLLVTILVSWSWSRKDTINGILTGLIVVLLVSISGASWRSTGLTSQKSNELWDGMDYPIGSDNLNSSLETFAKWNSGQATGIYILVKGVDDPSLAWALRNYDHVDFSAVDEIEKQPAVIITSANGVIQSGSTYRGQDVTWIYRPDLDKMGVRDWARWRLFREAPETKTGYIMWVRNDIFPGG